MITPARIAITESSKAVVTAVLPNLLSLLKYEAYVIIHPKPRLREKKAWPIALRSTPELILLKSGENKNLIPSLNPDKKQELMQKATNNMNNKGIKIFDALSIPFVTPQIKIRKFANRKTDVQIIGLTPVVSEINCP